jgi:hypothetical protein
VEERTGEELALPVFDMSEERGVRGGVDDVVHGAEVRDQGNAIRVLSVREDFDVLLSRRVVKVEVAANDVR